MRLSDLGTTQYNIDLVYLLQDWIILVISAATVKTFSVSNDFHSLVWRSAMPHLKLYFYVITYEVQHQIASL